VASTAAAGPVPGLPSGTVSFLMSDIEGSTRLFHRWGSAYVPLLAEHRSLLREAVGRFGGVEVDTEGDALLSAFPEAGGAVSAALAGQVALQAHSWPEEGEVRVRIGVHTGQAEPEGGGYVSLAVHQVARICAAAHGGQVVVSRATAEAARGGLPTDAAFDPLGTFQLRGFPSPERLFQLRHPGLRGTFPPLRAIGVVPHNLPYLRTGLVGRDAERRALADLLPTTGILTVAGPGGVGKTRLAVQLAFDVMADHADGAWLVELAPVTDPARVPRTVAAALHLPEQPGRPVEDVLATALATQELLLLLDNCEHLLDAVATLVDDLVQRCPRLTVLTTSREPLDVDGELVWRLAPLSTGGTETSVPSDAARLFADRAALVRPGFALGPESTPDVERLVAHLDGLPLAIELAAAALADRPLSAVVDGLSDRFGLLSRGRRSAPGRHQTLRAALAWSLDLLSPAERTVLARMSVFAGGGTLPAAAEVCAAPPYGPADVVAALHRLVRASLVAQQPGREERWSMPESVRELAALELATAGEAEETARRHRQWFTAHVEALEPEVGRSDRADVMTELAADHDNVRRALDSAVSTGDAGAALRLAAAAAPFWMSAGHWTEGAERLAAALGLAGGDERLRARALVAAGQQALLLGELEIAEDRFEAARPLARDDATAARVLSGTGYVAFRRSRLDDAESNWRDGLIRARASADPRLTAGLLRSLAIAAGSHGDQDRALELLSEAVAAARTAGDGQLLRQILGSSGEVSLWLGDYQQAADRYGDALDVATGIGDLSARPLLLAELGWVSLLRGDVPLAERLAVEAIDLAEDLGNRRVLGHALRLRGEALLRRGGPDEAADALRRALSVAEDYGAPAEVAGVRCSLASVAYENLRLDEAREMAESARSLSALPHPMRLVLPECLLGAVALAAGDPEGGRHWFTASAGPQGAPSAPRHRAAAHWGLAAVARLTGRDAESVTRQMRAVRLRSRLPDRLGVADSFVGLAAAIAPAEPAEAGRLLGAARAALELAGAVPTPRQQAEQSDVGRRAAGPAAAAELAAAADGPREDVDAAVGRATALESRMTGDPADADPAAPVHTT
jgi:predicted ATPase/class 3 adenylate cyclase